jgi:hypothetical protein
MKMIGICAVSTIALSWRAPLQTISAAMAASTARYRASYRARCNTGFAAGGKRHGVARLVKRIVQHHARLSGTSSTISVAVVPVSIVVRAVGGQLSGRVQASCS